MTGRPAPVLGHAGYSRFFGQFRWVGRNRRINDNRRQHLGAGRSALSRLAIGKGKGTS